MMHDISKRKLRKKPFWLVLRLVMKFLDRVYVENHFVNAWWIRQELEKAGFKRPIEIMLTPLKYKTPLIKREHEGVNVMYYKPPRKDLKWRDWLYGIDLIEKLKEEYKDKVKFIEVDQSYDMEWVFPDIDLYIRPNRHDGYSRLIRECEIQEIPYYWSHENPDYDEMKKKLDEVIENCRKV